MNVYNYDGGRQGHARLLEDSAIAAALYALVLQESLERILQGGLARTLLHSPARILLRGVYIVVAT